MEHKNTQPRCSRDASQKPAETWMGRRTSPCRCSNVNPKTRAGSLTALAQARRPSNRGSGPEVPRRRSNPAPNSPHMASHYDTFLRAPADADPAAASKNNAPQSELVLRKDAEHCCSLGGQ